MTGSDDQQFVITLVTVVNTSSIPFLERDRTPSVTSDEKKRKTQIVLNLRTAYHSAFCNSRLWQATPRVCRVLRFRPRRARRFHPHS